ncbi:MAG: T9SS type A sorting domain-containing protein, partial [Salibacteraceae bacterium]
YPFKSYMIDNVEGGNGGVDMYDEEGYTSIDKYTTLTNHRAEAGNTEDRGNDVIQVASVQEVDLDIGDEETVVFALHAGKSIEELIQSADAAFERFYGHLPGENVDGFMEIRSLWPNPTRDNLQLSFDLSEKSQVFLKVHNATGDRVFEYDSNTLYAGFNLLDIDLPKLRSGFYFIHIHTLDFSESLPFQYLAR